MDVKQALTRYLAGQGRVEGFRPLSGGWETEVYAYDLDGAPKVLRLYQGRHVEARAGNEFRMLRSLGRMGYPVPQVEHYNGDPGVMGGPFLLMERVEGRPMAALFGDRPSEELVSDLVGLAVRLHRMDWRSFVGEGGVWPDLESARGLYAITWVARLLRGDELLEAVQPLLDWLEEQGRAVEFQLAPLHGDLHFENVLVRSDGSLAVIDWGITGVGDPRCDLAYSYVLLSTQGHPALADRVLKRYEAMAGPQANWAYFEAWALIQRLVILLVVLARGSAAMGMRPGLEGKMREQIGYIRLVAGLVADRTGLALPGIEARLAE